MDDTITSVKEYQRNVQHLDTLLKEHQIIFQALPIPIYISVDGEKISLVNREAARFGERTAEDYMGKSLKQLQQTLGIETLEKINTPTGERAVALFNQNEEYYRLEVIPYGERGKMQIIYNITDAHEALQIIDSLSFNAPGGIFKVKLDEELSILYSNEIFYTMHGYTEAQLKAELDNKALRFVHPDDQAQLRKKIQEALASNSCTCFFEVRTIKRDQDIRWMLVSAYFTDIPNGKALYGFTVDCTNQRETEQKLKISEERFRIALSMIDSGFWDYDIQTKELHQYGDFLRKYGIYDPILKNVPESLVDQGIIHPESVADFYKMYERMKAGDRITNWTGKVRNQSGEYLWTKITHHSIFDNLNQPIRAIGVYENIQEKRDMEIRYQDEVAYREAMTSDIIASYKVNLTKDEMENPKRNNALLDELPEHCTHDDILASGIRTIVNPEDKRKYYELFSPESLFRSFANGESNVEMEYLRQIKNGDILWVSTICNLMKEPHSGDLYVFTYTRNIDKRKKLELDLREKAERDSLTLLYNKATTKSLINDYLQSRGYLNQQCALCMIDIDKFKLVNDNLGHAYGDKVLCDIANILKNNVRSNDIVGRVGGDEFIIFFKNIVSEDWIHHKAKKICKALNLSHNTDFHISGSMGIVLAKTSEVHFQWLYEKADLALYQAKNAGKNGYFVFQETRNALTAIKKSG